MSQDASKAAVEAQGLWAVRLTVARALGPAIEDALSGIALSVSRFEDNPGWPEPSDTWCIEAITETEPDREALTSLIAATAEALGTPAPAFEIAPIADIDWLARNRRAFPPVAAGRFFIYGTHFEGTVPEGKVGIVLDAGPAFGSGTHGSTQGALMAIDRLAGENPLQRVLDIGCGSGILAIALALTTRAVITASDLEQAAADNVRFNADANGVSSRIAALCEEGVGAGIRARAPYDLVAANILAEPLMKMAGDLAEITVAGAAVILSGLIGAQEQNVLDAYRRAGFDHRLTLVLGPWSTLVVRRRSEREPED